MVGWYPCLGKGAVATAAITVCVPRKSQHRLQEGTYAWQAGADEICPGFNDGEYHVVNALVCRVRDQVYRVERHEANDSGDYSPEMVPD